MNITPRDHSAMPVRPTRRDEEEPEPAPARAPGWAERRAAQRFDEPRKPRRRGQWSWRNLPTWAQVVLPLAIIAIGVALFNIAQSGSSSGTSTAPYDDVVYTVTGSASGVTVTYQSTSGSSQATSAGLPYTHDETMTAGSFVYVSAQNDANGGPISCSITSNERVVASNTSTGAFAVVECSGHS